ncbi:hypothetical protein RA27_06435 [Ruegeria sp. ANG-R]|nr:hypothetical protein RA27_06435 [Ruegeria sp. ANG-R]
MAFEECRQWTLSGQSDVFSKDWNEIVAGTKFNNGQLSIRVNTRFPFYVSTIERGPDRRTCTVGHADTSRRTFVWANGEVNVGSLWDNVRAIDEADLHSQFEALSGDLRDDPEILSLVRSEVSGVEIFAVCRVLDTQSLTVSPPSGNSPDWELSAIWSDEAPDSSAFENCP